MGGWFAPDISTVSRGKGDAPSTAKAAYRAGLTITDERTGVTYDFSRKQGVEWSGTASAEGAPEWSRERVRLWNEVERKENRKNSVVARELMAPLPADVPQAERERITREVMAFLVERYGVAVDASIHAPSRKGDQRNHHAHILFTTRSLGRDGWGEKVRALDECVKKGPDGQSIGGQEVEAIRAALADITNRALERCNAPYRVDHRSYERRGIEREAEIHLGPVAMQMERRGQRSDRGDERREIQARNAERDKLKAEAKIINLQLERLKRQEQQRQQQRQADTGRQRERGIERQQVRFEVWANARRAEQQNQRIEQTGELERRHGAERLELQNQQQKTYGKQLKALAKEAAAIATRQQKAKGWRGMVYRVTGQQDRDAVRTVEIKASLASIEQRKAEQAKALGMRQYDEKAALDRRHAEQERRLEGTIRQEHERRGLAGSGHELAPAKAGEARREATTGKAIEADRGGRPAEAENSPVEGRDVQAGKTTPDNEQATHAPPEANSGGNSGNDKPRPKQWGLTPEAEAEAVRATLEKWAAERAAAQERGYDTGRTRSR